MMVLMTEAMCARPMREADRYSCLARNAGLAWASSLTVTDWVTLMPTVRRDARIVVRQNYYSVPARFIGTTIRVSLRASELVAFDRNQIVARHARLTHGWHYRDNLDHYLEILKIKPGALVGSTALAQARDAGTFTTIHDAFWAAARTAHGEAAGTRALIEVLLLHRRMDHTAVLAGMTVTLQAGSTSPDLVAIEAR